MLEQPMPRLLEIVTAERFDNVAILKKLVEARSQLAELKSLVKSLPHPEILINTLAMQEAKDSSEIESLVTTHDDLYQNDYLPEQSRNPVTKEVHRYRQALRAGFDLVNAHGLLTSNTIAEIQGVLEPARAGFRKLPGTVLKNDATKEVVFTPPQTHDEIIRLMTDLEKVINEPDVLPVDPLIRMAVVHHRFETIHPFYDGNGRTGRIINVLMLVKDGLLELPILYLSRTILRRCSEYYRLLQAVRLEDKWEEWVLYMLDAVEQTARQTSRTVADIRDAQAEYKQIIRRDYSFYSQELLNSLFCHPYMQIEILQQELKKSRFTVMKYLKQLTDANLLQKREIGRRSFYVNVRLWEILTRIGA